MVESESLPSSLDVSQTSSFSVERSSRTREMVHYMSVHRSKIGSTDLTCAIDHGRLQDTTARREKISRGVLYCKINSVAVCLIAFQQQTIDSHPLCSWEVEIDSIQGSQFSD
jgi:hypothetical protein